MANSFVRKELVIENHCTKDDPIYKVRPEIIVYDREGTAYVQPIGAPMTWFLNNAFDAVVIAEPRSGGRDSLRSLNGVQNIAREFGSLKA